MTLIRKDVLIIGQGLAGTALAFSLTEKGLSVHVVDDNHSSASSLVGVAVINPVTGRRYAKSWNIDSLIPLVSDFYTRTGLLLGKQYLGPAKIFQVLSDTRIEEIWMMRAADPEFQSYLDTEISTLTIPGLDSIRYAEIHRAFHLQVSQFIHDSARWFIQKGILKTEAFDISLMKTSEDSISYQDLTYQHVVFCEGHRIIQNSLFNWLEIMPMKGEYLICRIPGLNLGEHVKSGVSIIPFPEHDLYWCGATYDRYNQSKQPTDAARNDLLKQLKQIVQLPVFIEHHGVGIRATTRDRRPYVGTHPNNERVHLIAGLGTKGASLAPYCATLLSEYLYAGKTIPNEVDILRHSQR